MLLDLLESAQHLPHLFRAVRHRIQSDHRITGTETEALQGRGGNSLRVIGGMVWLQTAAQSPRQTDGGIAMGCHSDFVGCINQIQIAHQFTDRRHHFSGQTTTDFPDIRPSGFLRQNPFPELRHRPAPDFGINRFIHIILDDPGDFVFFIRHCRMLPQITQSQG